ncbi:MAG: DUF2442 domain-containing protein [Deltaproteobacteria bacterium]|nr:DUF2442 domain-containing protein [Deltaproteobacteria bacterium]
MRYEIIDIVHVQEYRLEIFFKDGKNGVVDLRGLIKRGGIFSRLADLDLFKQFYIDKELGVLCWPGGLDIAPETLYHEATREPLPEWMMSGESGKKAG